MTGITKAYPGVIALSAAPGEIHAVPGENRAGKSTVVKILYGAVKPDAGRIAINGRTVSVSSQWVK